MKEKIEIECILDCHEEDLQYQNEIKFTKETVCDQDHKNIRDGNSLEKQRGEKLSWEDCLESSEKN